MMCLIASCFCNMKELMNLSGFSVTCSAFTPVPPNGGLKLLIFPRVSVCVHVSMSSQYIYLVSTGWKHNKSFNKEKLVQIKEASVFLDKFVF